MPELPEVETTCRGIEPHILNQIITDVVVRHPRLRWPIPKNLQTILVGEKILEINRRAKYILLQTKKGTLILHLGMSGHLRIVTKTTPVKKHDHVDIEFKNNKILRFNDPRRFGAVLWTNDSPLQHDLLKDLGVEPLTTDFSAKYLQEKARNRSVPIKSFIMDNKIVTGVGNIYATEALFVAKLHPLLPAKEVSLEALKKLVSAIKSILKTAIKNGGTTLKDFANSEGKPGYFSNHLQVYGRADEACFECGTQIEAVKIGQRTTSFCSHCQAM